MASVVEATKHYCFKFNPSKGTTDLIYFNDPITYFVDSKVMKNLLLELQDCIRQKEEYEENCIKTDIQKLEAEVKQRQEKIDYLRNKLNKDKVADHYDSNFPD